MKALSYIVFGVIYLSCFFLILKGITPNYRKGLEQSLKLKSSILGR